MTDPAGKVVKVDRSKLVPNARNARVHTDTQVMQIAASIREWGWTMPVLIDEDNTIIAGHARVQAAEKLGIKRVPCVVARDWSDAKKRAYILADNKLTLNSDWDDNLLATELSELMEQDFSIELTGFDEDEVKGLLSDMDDYFNEGEEEEEETPSKTDDNYTEFSVVLSKGNKEKLVSALANIRESHGAGNVEEALMVMVNDYA